MVEDDDDGGAAQEPTPSGAWFNPIASFLGPGYLKNAFTDAT